MASLLDNAVIAKGSTPMTSKFEVFRRFVSAAFVLGLCLIPVVKYGLEQRITYWIFSTCYYLIFCLSMLFPKLLKRPFQRAFMRWGYTRESGEGVLGTTMFLGLVLTIGLGWARGPSELKPFLLMFFFCIIFALITVKKQD